MQDNFKFIIPAELVKGQDGEWKVAGLASTPSVDKQGEVIVPAGIDGTPIAQGKGFFNFDHDNSPESTIGVLDSYKKSSNGMYVEGRLFKNHSRAKAIYEIMTSLNKGDKGRVGMSVEGKVVERDIANPKIIKRCIIKNVALTLSPVNQDTYADIIKSMSSEAAIEFDSTGKKESSETNNVSKSNEPTFSASEVVAMIEKALGVGAGNSMAPGDRSGGDALGQEEMDKKKKKVESKKLKPMNKQMYKSTMLEVLDKLQVIYPNNSRSEIWEAVKERMETKFPQIKEL